MSRILLLLLFCIANASAASVDCAEGSLQSYIDLGAGGCALGGVTVSDFQLGTLSAGSAAILAPQVTITPNLSGDRYSLLFGYNVAAALGQPLENSVLFNVSGEVPLGVVQLNLTGTDVAPDGVALSNVELCPAGFLSETCTGISTFLIVTDTGGGTGPEAAPFGPLSSFQLRVNSVADPGLGGSALLGQAELALTAVPEPSMFTALMAGLAAIAYLSRRRRR